MLSLHRDIDVWTWDEASVNQHIRKREPKTLVEVEALLYEWANLKTFKRTFEFEFHPIPSGSDVGNPKDCPGC